MRSYNHLLRALIAFAALLMFLGEDASAQRASETIEVSIVNVDVHVSDRKGNRVSGLTAKDFEIRENGQLQPITNFAEYTTAVADGETSIDAPAQPAVSPPANARRTMVFFIEPMTLAGFRAKELFDAMRHLVRTTMRPGDRAAVATWSRFMRLRQPPTSEMSTLLAVLDAIEKEFAGVQGNPGAEIRRQQAETDALDRQYAASLARAGLSPRISGGNVDARSAALRQLLQIKHKSAAVESLMQSISGIEGRKIVVLATQRFGRYAGAEFFGGTVPTELRQELDTARFRDSLIRMANAHGITIYPLHPEGLVWTPFPETPAASQADAEMQRLSLDNAVLLNETTALQEIATQTGGLLASGTKSIAAILPRVTEDLDAYYSLGYRAQGTREDMTRAIVVKTKNSDYVVRARRQVVEKSDATRMKDRVVASLFQDLGGTTIPIGVKAEAAQKTAGKRWTVPLTIQIPIVKLTTLREAKGEAGAFSVFIVAGAVFGTMSEVEQRTQSFTIPAEDLQRARTSTFRYEFTLRVDDFADRVVVGVLDEVSKEYGLARIGIPAR